MTTVATRVAAPRSTTASQRPRARPRTTCSRRTPGTSGARTCSERAWGTVREDYSADGDAWDYFPHDHARSRVYRWNEDGMAGISDVRQELCLALALWNGVDPILKERMFGLTGPQGNHGEDVKEYWWYLDGLPSHSLLQWRYHYPQAPFPYGELVAQNAARGRHDPEYELLDTGVFDDDRYWIGRRDLREGLTDRDPASDPDRQPRDGSGDDRRAADAVVPQHVAVGRRRADPRAAPRRATPSSSVTTGCRATGSRLRPAPAVHGRRRCSATTRPTPRDCSAPEPTTPVPEGRHQRPRRLRRGDGQPGAAGHQGGVALPRQRGRR